MRSGERIDPWPGASLRLLRFATSALALVVALGAAPAIAGVWPAVVTRSETELLLLAIKLGPHDLDLTIPSYPGGAGTLVPLGALAQGLDLAIRVEAASGVAHGFVLHERRRFGLVAGSDSVWVDGAVRGYAANQLEWHADDVYVDTRLLAEWLPIDLAVDRRASTLTVHPREPLPAQQRLERERAFRGTFVAAAPADDPERLQAPFRFWGWPATDHTLHLFRRENAFGSANGFQYTSNATGDLLYLEAHGFMAGDDGNPMRDARFAMGRRDPDPVLLGPLGAREVMAGDVMDPGLELVSYPSAGRGASVSSFPLYDENEHDRRTFRGDLAPGWDVELYRNDALLGYRQAGAGSVYEFPGVPLLYGVNEFRLQFYGPQGQTRTEVRTVHLGRSLTPQGRTDYRVMAHERADGNFSGHAEFSTGITKQLSLTARVAGLEQEHGSRLYEGVGLRLGWDRLFVKTDAMVDQTRGTVLQAALATRLGPVGLWAQHARLNEFRSEVFQPMLGKILDRTGVRVDLDLRRAGWPRVPSSLEWRHDRLADGTVHDLIHEVSIARRGLGVSNRFQARYVRAGGASPPVERRGALLIHRGLSRVNLRGGVDYTFEHGAELRDVSLTAETQRFGPLIAAEIRRSVQSRETSGHLSVTRGYGPVGVALRSDVSSTSGSGVSLLLSFSFDREPRTRQWQVSARPRSESGTVSAQVFLDANGNGRRDLSEEPLEGVRLRATPGGSEVRTDSDGIALLRDFPSGHPSDVELVTSSLEDPLRIPRRRDVAILPRAGSTLLVDFPIVLCGEITGTTYLRRGGVTRPLAGARLELVSDADGSVVKRARSAFDGYYDIAGVPPGRYRLCATAPGSRRDEVRFATIPIEIGPGGPILESMDLTLIGGSLQIAGEDEP